MANARICPVNFFDDAVLVESPAFVSTMPATFAQLTARDSAARSASNGDQVIKGHFNGQGRRSDSFFLFDHNGYGGKVRLQLHRHSDFTVDVYDSGAQYIVGAASPIDDGSWGVAPLGVPIDDVLIQEAPHYLLHTATTFQSFTITFTRCQQAYWEIGRIFMGKSREMPSNPRHGLSFGWVTDAARQRSRGASLRCRPGARWRDLSASMFYLTDAQRAIWRDLLGQITNQDCAITLRPGAGGREERDHVANMQLTQHTPFNWGVGSIHETTVTFTEV